MAQSEVQGTPAQKPAAIAPSDPADQESHDTKDLEQLLKRYNTDSKKVLEDNSKLQENSDAAVSEVKDSDIEEMRPSEDPIKEATARALKKSNDELEKKAKLKAVAPSSSDISQSVRMALEPIQMLSEQELLKRLDEATKDSPMRPYMKEFPNITIFAVKLLKDKESIPALAKIVENRDRLIQFGAVMICTIIFGMILKKIMHKEGRSFIKSVFYFLFRVYLLVGIRILVVYYFFSAEFTPASKVFKKLFF